MKSNTYTTVIIESEQNHYLTQKDDSVDLKDRVIAKIIALGKYDSPDNYKEISEEEGNEIMVQQEELSKEIKEIEV